jgi:hypothetical protein
MKCALRKVKSFVFIWDVKFYQMEKIQGDVTEKLRSGWKSCETVGGMAWMLQLTEEAEVV